MSLVTPAKIRTLQRKLYRKAITTPLAAALCAEIRTVIAVLWSAGYREAPGGFKKIR
jgi:hypothetical protein